MMNKTAKEMFEELGYICDVFLEDEINYRKTFRKTGCEFNITFDSVHKECCINIDEEHKDIEVSIDVAELKAIYRQTKELGWLDE